MKRVLALAVLVFSLSSVQAQNPVTWSYSAKKIDDKTFEVHLTATIQAGWHLYSQTQPEDHVADPTSFSFAANPLLSLDGKVKEVGKMEKFHDAQLDISANQYSNKVDFVQVVKLKTSAKTNLTGKLTFQTCDDEKCLPPKTISFAVAIK